MSVDFLSWSKPSLDGGRVSGRGADRGPNTEAEAVVGVLCENQMEASFRLSDTKKEKTLQIEREI